MCALWAAVDFDLSLASKRLLGSVQPWFQLRMLLLRTGIAVVGGFLGDIRGAQAIVFFFLAGALVFEHVRWVSDALLPAAPLPGACCTSALGCCLCYCVLLMLVCKKLSGQQRARVRLDSHCLCLPCRRCRC